MTVSNTSKALKGMSSQTLVTLVLGVVEIVSFSIMSRLLTPKDFGYYAALSAVLVVFNSFAETGIGAALIQRKEMSQSFINNAFTLSIVIGLLVSLVLFVSSDFIANVVVDKTMSTPLRLMSLTIFCYSLTSPYISLLYKRLKFVAVGVINLISLILTTILAVVLALKGFGFYAIIAKTVTGSIITLLLVAIVSKTKFNFEWNSNTIKSIWNYSGWLMGSVIFRNISQQADRLLMSRLLTVDLLGAYNRPKEFITQISTKLNGIFDTALFPVLSSIQDDVGAIQRSFSKSMYLINLFSAILSLAFIVNAELIVRIFFGQEWLHLTLVFQLLSVSLIFNIDGRLADCYLRSLALTRSQFVFRVLETAILFVGVICGAQYGLIGVTIATVFSNFCLIIIKVCYISNHINFSIKSSAGIVFRAWRPAYILAPIFVALMTLIPHSLSFDVILAAIYTILVCTIFVLFPKAVGYDYSTFIYPEVISRIKHFLRTKLA